MQNEFWKANPDWLDTYYGGENKPYHPSQGGGAELMDPAHHYRAKEGATKATVTVGKGGMSAVEVEPVLQAWAPALEHAEMMSAEQIVSK